MNDKLENWVLDILADPLTKLPAGPDAIGITNGIVDARRYLPNTIGFDVWSSGQKFYEDWNRKTIEDYRGKTGRRPLDRKIKELARPVLVATGFKRFKDHHVFHPTFAHLQKLITDNGFSITDVYWQPAWRDQVCYISACSS